LSILDANAVLRFLLRDVEEQALAVKANLVENSSVIFFAGRLFAENKKLDFAMVPEMAVPPQTGYTKILPN
jgi:hypothetical protein